MAVGLLVGVISNWFSSYNDPNVFEVNQNVLMAVTTVIGSIIMTTRLRKHNYRVGVWVALGVLCAVILRIIFDILSVDRTSHSLMTVEIIIAMLVSIPSAFLGSFLVKVFKK